MRPISPVKLTCGAQHAQRSTPGTSTMRTGIASAFFCRNGIAASSSSAGQRMFIGRFFHTSSFARRSSRKSCSASISRSKSIVAPCSSMWKPMFSQPQSECAWPDTRCSAEWICMRAKRVSQSISPGTSAPSVSGEAQKWTISPFSSRVSVTCTPPSVPISPPCPPPSGKKAVRSSVTA